MFEISSMCGQVGPCAKSSEIAMFVYFVNDDITTLWGNIEGNPTLFYTLLVLSCEPDQNNSGSDLLVANIQSGKRLQL